MLDCDIACARQLSKHLVYLEFDVSTLGRSLNANTKQIGTRLVSNAVDGGALFSAKVTGIARVCFVESPRSCFPLDLFLL